MLVPVNRVVLSSAHSCALCTFTVIWSREWRCDSGKLLYSNAQILAWLNGAGEGKRTFASTHKCSATMPTPAPLSHTYLSNTLSIITSYHRVPIWWWWIYPVEWIYLALCREDWEATVHWSVSALWCIWCAAWWAVKWQGNRCILTTAESCDQMFEVFGIHGRFVWGIIISI